MPRAWLDFCLVSLLFAALILGLQPRPAAAAGKATVFYVSTAGNDAWSGRLAAPNAARTDGPFATITRARDAIRALKAKGPLNTPVEVQIRGGRYYLTKTIAFGPQDSGAAQAPINYMAYPGETPELVGGTLVRGLKPGPDGKWQVVLPEAKGGAWSFRSLFVNGQRQIRARYPNYDPADPYRKGFLYAATDPMAFGISVGNIHNVGDYMDYKLQVLAAGDYDFWMYYGALNAPFGHTTMAGRTALSVDGGKPVLLQNLADTGGWGVYKWARAATVHLTAGHHTFRWQNLKGGGLDLEAYAFCDDPNWRPVNTHLPPAAAGKHVLLVQAENFTDSHGKQLTVSGSGGGSKTQIYCAPGTFQPAWAKAPGAELHIFQTSSCRAFMEILFLDKYNAATRQLTLKGSEAVTGLNAGDRYFIENIPGAVDSPGEWYLDPSTGLLTYQPIPGFSAQTEVVAPRLGRIFEFDGDAANKQEVSNLRLIGLTLRNTDWTLNDGCTGYGIGKDGVVYLQDARNCAVQDCVFSNIGKYAVCLQGGGDNTITGNEIGHSAEGGILLLDSGGNTVTQNHIHNCGEGYKHIGAVVLSGAGASNNTVAHNTIHDISRYGISMKNAGSKNLIEYNRIMNTNLETYDTGGIEVTQGNRTFHSGTIISHNLVADTIGYSCSGGKPVYLSWGIYLDSFAGGYTVTDNVVYRDWSGGIMLQGGKGNTVTNNIFVDGQRYQGYISNFSSNFADEVLEHNIFYYTGPEATLFGTGKFTPKVINIDYNLYYPLGGAQPRVGYGGMPFADWQKAGFDKHSVVADPRFVNPAADDYTLRPDSPAFKLGFQPIDTSDIGVTNRPCHPKIVPASKVYWSGGK